MVPVAMAEDRRTTDPMQLATLRERVRDLHERVVALGRHL